MPAKNLRRVVEGGTYCHVYNKGIENKTIFADDSDYKTFLGFLEEYLSTPRPTEAKKAEFTVNGKVFKGIPHQPKNYHDKVELIAYGLRPNSFHLLLHQKADKSLQAFIRSLCTRYSMYFNKKYSRSGTLFDGPYKSHQIDDKKGLAYSVLQLNKGENHTSQLEYSGQRNTDWVKTNIVLSIVGTIDNINDYIADYEPTYKDNILLEEKPQPTPNQPLERRDLETVSLKPWSRIPELAAASAVLVLLLGLGLRNISTASKSNPVYPVTLGTSTTTVFPSPTPSPEPDLKSEVNKTEATSQADTKPVNSDD